MQIIRCSDSSLLAKFGDSISPEANAHALRLFASLARRRDDRILNLHPAYASLLIDFDPLRATHTEIEDVVRHADASSETSQVASEVHIIPVCYGGEFGPDLEQVSTELNLTPEQVIEAHTRSAYYVYFIGFSPGFAYMGGLPPELELSRLASPRKSVPAGSVAIAGKQAGIYPQSSPGGWRLLGRTPVTLFNPANDDHPTLLQPGDTVWFRPIDRNAFDRIRNERSDD